MIMARSLSRKNGMKEGARTNELIQVYTSLHN